MCSVHFVKMHNRYNLLLSTMKRTCGPYLWTFIPPYSLSEFNDVPTESTCMQIPFVWSFVSISRLGWHRSCVFLAIYKMPFQLCLNHRRKKKQQTIFQVMFFHYIVSQKSYSFKSVANFSYDSSCKQPEIPWNTNAENRVGVLLIFAWPFGIH